jgi:hypothetical protein
MFSSLLILIASLLSAQPSLAAEAKTAEQLILENPVKMYEIYSARLRKHGANASFPEFKPVVDHLRAKLESAEFRQKVAAEKGLSLEHTEVLTMLFHVNLEFVFDDAEKYPYDRPFDGPFPYRPTIDAIENAIRLIDKVERIHNPKAVPLYHFDRYAYHRHSLLADTEIVVFPTLKPLSFTDLVRVRPVPFGFVGVVTETIRVDRHWQTPLDFWYHDLNHVRRMVAYIQLRAKIIGAKTLKQKRAFYKKMDDFVVNEIMPNIKALPKGSDPDAINIRKLVRVILFEILHESALTSEREVIIEDLLRGPDVPQPFEHMMPRLGIKDGGTESLRTATGNLESGAAALSRSGDDAPTVIRYFHDRALGLLANVYNKINYGFFDDPASPAAYVASVDARKADYVAKAATAVLEFLGHENPPSHEQLRELVLSKKGSPEKFVYPRINDHEGLVEQGPTTTEPITSEEVIAQVRGIGKKVYTLFGFSVLDYHKKRDAMAVIRRELEPLDRKTTIINIGATEEGIGAAYEIAKAMGFETMGIVSTQALTYSGKFSRFVDRIFIVNDKNWGGYDPGTGQLTPATKAFLESSDFISFHGGGENSAVTMEQAHKRGIPHQFTPAEMNHDTATKRALEQGKPVPTDFRGAAYHMWQKLRPLDKPDCSELNRIL